MKRGFTLVELLGVLVIIGIMALIVIPMINDVVTDSREDNYKFQLSQIEVAAKSWALDNLLSIVDDGELVTITLAQLKVSGYIDKDIRNPINKEYFPNDMEILITRKGITSLVQILENTGGDIDEFDTNILAFVLHGKVIEAVELNGTYVDEGIIFTDADGQEVVSTAEIKYGDTVVAEIDESVVGKYTITYTASNGTNISKVVRTVIVKDSTPPVFSGLGPIEILIGNIGSLDLEAGVTVTDNSLEVLTFTITGTVPPQIGNYAVTYKAVDSAGNVATKSRIVKVIEPQIYADASGAAYPVLRANMIPIRWTGTEWVKADLTQEWYDYTAKEWANAVLVTSGTRATYLSAAAGTTIQNADVLAYMVWIPRYNYQVFNASKVSQSASVINVDFTDLTEADLNGSTNGTYKTHPAFTFGAERVAGIWVGKFETTGSAVTPTVLPGIASLRSQTVAVQYSTSRLMTGATYGLSTDMDSHMAKNLEWGAIAYLSRSQFGAIGEIAQNTNASYLTGGAGGTVYTINTTQTTTGNVYGVYDMHGGSSEYVMGAIYNSDNTTIRIRSGGFAQATIDGAAMSKYIDKYLYGTLTNDYAARTKLGDATGETYGWYTDTATFPASNNTWFLRGGNGIFAFTGTSGAGAVSYGFRMVFTPITG